MLTTTPIESTYTLVVFVVIGLSAVILYRVVRWLCTGPVQPEPWEKDVADAMESEQARPLCCHCLEPHDIDASFCPDCGAPVGQYTNLLPFPYLFSIGHLLRTGTRGDFKRTPLTMVGFVLLGLIEYSIFAPVYWIRLAFSGKPSAPVSDSSPPVSPPNG
jgi:hypothetical protein